MTDQTITVYYDGACPLCVREIALLRRLDLERGRMRFEDVAPPGTQPSCSIDRDTLLARFHVRLPDDTIVVGARAFTEAWSQIPGLQWVQAIGRFTPTRVVLDQVYRAFLIIRPGLQAALRLVTKS